MTDTSGAPSPQPPPAPDEPASTVVKVLRGTLLVLLVGIAYLVVMTPQESGGNGVGVPSFDLETLAGSRVSHHDLKGRVTVLNFLATWCGPCKAEMPELVSFARAHEGDNVAVLGVSAGFDEPAKLSPFVRAFRVPFPVLLRGEPLLEGMGFATLPTTVMVGPDGKVAMVWEGATNRAVLERGLAQVQASSSP